MDDLTFRTDYWSDADARAAFKDFILEIHGLDFTQWEQAGFWDGAYRPFTFFDGDRVVASVCLYLIDAVVHGERRRLAQISGVGTLATHRRRGLSRDLTDRALAWAETQGHAGVCLFADDDAVPYYERCGFSALDEHVEGATLPAPSRREGARALDAGDAADRERVHRLALGRAPVSNELGVLMPNLLMFHALHRLRHRAWEIPDLDCVVFCDHDEGGLRVFDIVAAEIPPFRELHPYIAEPGDSFVEFHFAADRMGIDGIERRPLVGNNPYTRGSFPVVKPVFPFTMRA